LLVGHYDAPGPKSQQKDLHEHLKSRFPGRTKLVQVRVSQRPAKNAESSLRSRSIVFLGLAIYAASEVGREIPLLAPENGTIALNLPLTPSRSGSCSTRTMHPFYLDTLRSVLNDLGLKNSLLNPLRLKTKGECVTGCRDQALLSSLVLKTVSCSHGTRRQEWKRKKATNCGYYIPCLFRRASLHAAKLDSGKDYGIDVCSDELTVDSDRTSADDLRALTSALRHFGNEAQIRKGIRPSCSGRTARRQPAWCRYPTPVVDNQIGGVGPHRACLAIGWLGPNYLRWRLSRGYQVANCGSSKPRATYISGYQSPGSNSVYDTMPTISIDAPSASEVSQRYNVLVYSLYAVGVGRAARSAWDMELGLGGLAQVADETGGECLSLGTSQLVTFKPYLENLQKMLSNQYYVVFEAVPRKKSGFQRINIQTEVSNSELEAPDNVWVPAAGESAN
jgi:hypothetical protein